MIWAAMIISGVLTFAARFSMIGLIGDRPIPRAIRKLNAFVGPSVMAAIIFPATLVVDGHLMFADNVKIPALLIAGIVAFITGNVLATIGTGMVMLWLISHGLWLI
jgi:branched-subunit amino acid transport protein